MGLIPDTILEAAALGILLIAIDADNARAVTNPLFNTIIYIQIWNIVTRS